MRGASLFCACALGRAWKTGRCSFHADFFYIGQGSTDKIRQLTDSIFSRVFSYRQRENHSPLENFLTEIFAYCIESDETFRQDFMATCLCLNIPKKEIPAITTQLEYDNYGRPDVEINYQNISILIECKVEASERENQLFDYAEILNRYKKDKKKHIVFLTKYYEHKELNNENINLHLIRWYSIYEIINERHLQITNHLKYFLKEHGMEKLNSFTLQDLVAMQTIAETMSKMDELLEQFKPEFEKQFGGYSKSSSRSTRLSNNIYINFVELNYNDSPYYLLIGFFWWGELKIPCVGISLEIPMKKSQHSELTRILYKTLVEELKWNFEDDGTYYYYSSSKLLTDFISSEDDGLPAMKKFLQSQLDSLYILRKRFPKLLIK